MQNPYKKEERIWAAYLFQKEELNLNEKTIPILNMLLHICAHVLPEYTCFITGSFPAYLLKKTNNFKTVVLHIDIGMNGTRLLVTQIFNKIKRFCTVPNNISFNKIKSYRLLRGQNTFEATLKISKYITLHCLIFRRRQNFTQEETIFDRLNKLDLDIIKCAITYFNSSLTIFNLNQKISVEKSVTTLERKLKYKLRRIDKQLNPDSLKTLALQKILEEKHEQYSLKAFINEIMKHK